MHLPASTVAVFEENRMRADLYALWLDEYDVDVALTRGQAGEVLDGRVVVAVLNQRFADGEASKLLEIIQARAPLCRIIATRDRSDTYPDLNVDHHLLKPVFEEELVEMTERLLRRANYHLALGRYYQTNVDLSSFEIHDGGPATDEDEYDYLQRRATHLQNLIVSLSQEMTTEDVQAVKRDVLLDSDVEAAEKSDKKYPEKIDNKYRPGKCSNCGQRWDSDPGEEPKATQLGAYVWRCINCSHVQMHGDPSHQDIGSYRR